MAIRYYAVVHGDRTPEDPYAVFRYDDEAHSFEYQNAETEDWTPDTKWDFAAFIFLGELGAEPITETQVTAALAALASQPRPA